MAPNLAAADIPRLVEAGLNALRAQEDEVNRLNVFPVPDGDTGTNMVLTMKSVVEEVARAEDRTLGGLGQAAAYGALTGARGNSGVILSQIIRGFASAIEGRREVGGPDVVRGLAEAVRVAYQAVRMPVEGTMLTVLKDMAAVAETLGGEKQSLDTLLEGIVAEGRRSVQRTPSLLAVLKESGVVDAGGHGLVVIAEGMLAGSRGEEVATVEMVAAPTQAEEVELTYGYCTEMLIAGNGIDLPALEKRIARLGDSVIVVGSDTLARVHVHTDRPGKVLEMGTALGQVSQVDINNMREQARERAALISGGGAAAELGVVAVGVGDGVRAILRSLGVERIVDGGQTMNPSAAEIREAAERLGARQAIVLPNNKNIVLTGQQAAGLPGKPLHVVPTTSVVEGFAAMLEFDPARSPEENVASMDEARQQVRTGEVTTAVRDSTVGGRRVRRGQFIGLVDNDIKAVGSKAAPVLFKLTDAMLGEGGEVVTVISGADITLKEGNRVADRIKRAHPDVEVEHHQGGQPLYHYWIGVE